MTRLRIALALLFALGLCPGVHADDLTGYQAAVARALAAAEAAQASAGEERAAKLAEARRALESVGPIGPEPAGGTRPDNAALLDLLRAEGDLDAAIRRLRALQVATAALGAPAAAPADAAERGLRDVLSRPEFQPRPESIRTRLLRWLVENVLAPILERFPGGEGTQNALTLVGLASVLLVLGFATWRMQGTLNPRALREASAGAPATVRSLEERRRADAEAARGNYRQALHHLYLALLYELDDTGRLRFDPSLTNRELVAASGAGPELVALVDRYDATWYGLADVTEPEFHRFRQAIEGLRPSARADRAGAPAGEGAG